jgi:hypothetical protein
MVPKSSLVSTPSTRRRCWAVRAFGGVVLGPERPSPCFPRHRCTMRSSRPSSSHAALWRAPSASKNASAQQQCSDGGQVAPRTTGGGIPDGAGLTTVEYKTDPFGNVRLSEGDTDNRTTFTGQLVPAYLDASVRRRDHGSESAQERVRRGFPRARDERRCRRRGGCRAGLRERAEPLADQREPRFVDRVDARSPAPFVMYEAGVFEHS